MRKKIISFDLISMYALRWIIDQCDATIVFYGKKTEYSVTTKFFLRRYNTRKKK